MSDVDDRPLRFGILGCARIVRRGLIPGLLASRHATLHALASRNIETARAWAEEFDVPRSHDSYEALIADPDVDAVYIPLPNELHRPWVLRAAEAGKHILCEKPLALNADEAKEMVASCHRHGVVLMEAFMWRHQARTDELRRMVAEGSIGRVRLIRSSFSFPIEPDDWRLDPDRGGGALWDVGCYGISTLRLFAGAEPTRIEASAHFGPTGVDLSLNALLEFPDDILGLIDCSFEQPFRCTYEIVGTHGAITVPDAYLPPEKPTAELFGTGTDRDGRLGFDGGNQYGRMVDAFAEAIDAPDHTLPAPAEDGLQQMRVLDAVLKAARDARAEA